METNYVDILRAYSGLFLLKLIMSVIVYTDGSATNNADKNKRKAGCAYLITKNDDYIYLSGYYLNDDTNNRAELKAIYYSLCWLRHHVDNIDKSIYLISDSKYSINILTRVNKAKINTDIIENIFKLEDMFKEHGISITYKHIEAHTKRKDKHSVANDLVDKTARDCAEHEKRIKKVYKSFGE